MRKISDLLRNIAEIVDLDTAAQSSPESDLESCLVSVSESSPESVPITVGDCFVGSRYRYRTLSAISRLTMTRADVILDYLKNNPTYVVSVKRETNEVLIRLA